MVIFHSSVSLPEGTWLVGPWKSSSCCGWLMALVGFHVQLFGPCARQALQKETWQLQECWVPEVNTYQPQTTNRTKTWISNFQWTWPTNSTLRFRDSSRPVNREAEHPYQLVGHWVEHPWNSQGRDPRAQQVLVGPPLNPHFFRFALRMWAENVVGILSEHPQINEDDEKVKGPAAMFWGSLGWLLAYFHLPSITQ